MSFKRLVLFTLIWNFATIGLCTNYYSIAAGGWSNTRGGASCGCSPPGVVPIGDTVFVDQMSCNDPSKPTSSSCAHFDDITGCHSINVNTLNGAIVVEPGGFLLNFSGLSSFGYIRIEAGGYLDDEGAVTIQAGGVAIVDGGLDWNGSLTVNPGGSMTGSGGVRCCGACSEFGTLNVSGEGCAGCGDGEIGSAPPIGPNPVDLLSFSYQVFDNLTMLNWITLAEENNSHFEIFRFKKDQLPVKIATILGNNNSSSPITYEYADNNPVDGTSYYELRQVDHDGTTASLKIISVNRESKIKLFVFPNPVNDIMNYRIENKNLTISSMTIYNELGQVIYISFENDPQGRIYMKNYIPGIYFIEAVTEHSLIRKKFIIDRN